MDTFHFQNQLTLRLPERDRSRSMDNLKNEISVDSPRKNLYSGNIQHLAIKLFSVFSIIMKMPDSFQNHLVEILAALQD